MVVEADVYSLLTNISQYESPQSTPRSICLHADTRVTNFQRNDDPHVDEYMETSVERIGWEKYQLQCKKYGIPPIRDVKRCLEAESSDLNLAHYIPQSIGTAYAFEALNEQQPGVSLTKIDMTNCPMTETGCIALSDFIRRSRTLEYLNLRNTKIGFKGIEILEAGLFVNQSIKSINLSGCDLGDKGATILATSLNGNEVCKFLDISHNNFYIECGDALKTILTTTAIEVLNLGWNELYMDKTVNKIFQGLRDSQIKKFNFSWNGLSGTTWPKLFLHSLTKSDKLEIVNLENNRLTKVADQFMPGITKSKSLKRLYLGSNPWTEQDYINILNTFLKETTLSVLSLGNETYLTAECVALSIDAIKKNPNMEIIFKGQILDRPLTVVDFKGILADRLKVLAMKPKKKKLQRNIGHFFLTLREENIEHGEDEAFKQKLATFGAKLDEQLIEQVMEEWKVEITANNKKTKQIALIDMCEHYLSRHPTDPPVIVEKKPKEKKIRGRKEIKGREGENSKNGEKKKKKKKSNKL